MCVVEGGGGAGGEVGEEEEGEGEAHCLNYNTYLGTHGTMSDVGSLPGCLTLSIAGRRTSP